MTDAKRVATGVGWLYGHRWLERLLDFTAIVVLARVLAPEDFGLVAVAASFVAIAEGLTEFDVNQALIRIRDEDEALYDTAWSLSVIRGVVSMLFMVLIALLLSDGDVAKAVYALALTPLLRGLSNPRFAMFERELVYSKVAILTLTSKILSVSVTISLAMVYRNYWALVLGMLAGSVSSMVLTYVFIPYRPKLGLSRFSEIFSFSGWMSLAMMVTTISMHTDRIIVGRLIGIADAGLYFMTQRIGVLPTAELISPLRRIMFPSFSKIAEDKNRLRRVTCESVNVFGSLSVPAGFGFALVANDFVPIMLGTQWIAIVPLLQILTPYLGLSAALSMAQSCVMAMGHTKLMFQVSFIYALVHLPTFIAGTMLFGLTGSILSIVLAGVFYSYLNLWLLKQTLGISLADVLVQLKRPLSATAAMVSCVLLVASAQPAEFFSIEGSWHSLLIKLGMGVVVFLVTQYTIWRIQGKPQGIEQRLFQIWSIS